MKKTSFDKSFRHGRDSSQNTQERLPIDHSVISQNIHGKYSRIMFWDKWNEQSPSEDDFTVVSLHIPSNKEVTVHLKFYPAEPREGSIMIDYEVKFERYEEFVYLLCMNI